MLESAEATAWYTAAPSDLEASTLDHTSLRSLCIEIREVLKRFKT